MIFPVVSRAVAPFTKGLIDMSGVGQRAPLRQSWIVRVTAVAVLVIPAVACGRDRQSGTPADTTAGAALDTTSARVGDTAPVAIHESTAAGIRDTRPVSTPAVTKAPPAKKPAAPKAPKPAAAKPAAPDTTIAAAAPQADSQTAAAPPDANAPLRDPYHQAPIDTVTQVVYDGWKQFNLNCARCHGEDVQGTTIAPHLLVSLRPEGPINTKELFVQTVCAGRPAKGMPAWCSLGLGMDKINSIYSYVKGRSDGKIHPGRPAVRAGG
jgi:mono/diheme cytochrome c family protein